MKLIKKTLDSIPRPSEKEVFYWDEELKGFGVKAYPSGKKTFIFQYRNPQGQTKRVTIGVYGKISPDMARDAVKQLAAQTTFGEDPSQQKQNQKIKGLTLNDLAKDYLERHASVNKRSKSIYEDKRILEGYVLPKLGNVPVKEMNIRQIEDLRITMKETPYMANRVLALLSKMFTLAVTWGWCEKNPAIGVHKYQEEKRDRWLKEDELDRLKDALERYQNNASANALKMLILTGARKGEVLGAQWEHFDLERGIWTKPSHLTKQKKTEHVPLSAETLTFLKEIKEACTLTEQTSPYVFPGRIPNQPLTDIKNFWATVLKEAGIENLRMHDLRHTFASLLVSSGVSLSIVGKLLGHTQAGTTHRYAHLAVDPLRDAANIIGDIYAKKKNNS